MTNPKVKTSWLAFYFLFVTASIMAQNVDLETFGKGKAFKLGGGLSVNSIFYNSDQNVGREPFTYFLQGNLNVMFYQFSMPISYSYSNQGNLLNYNLPFNFNRLSLHPKYKWVTAHIGDVNMTFSPYTLNGHQFTGGGIDMVPSQSFTFSAMYGRLLKPTNEDDNPQTLPSYKRVGYGFKALLKKRKYSIGLITFYAQDKLNSAVIDPDKTRVLPKENLVLSIDSDVTLTKHLNLKGEYATTAITQDLRATTTDDAHEPLSHIFNHRASTEYYNAYRLNLDYRFAQATLGLGYERVDPGYETLGAYFFNNDFENITVNMARPFFSNKLNLAFSIGYQKDNLDGQKANPTNRSVGSVNASFYASEKLNLSGSYSNFSTYTNVKPNQFNDINDDNLLDNVLDTLDYRQVSQNANLNINYIIVKEKERQQNININYNVSDIANEQGGVTRIGDASTFHNMGLAYTFGFSKQNLNITPALNATYNTIGKEDASTWGPTLSINKKFLENTLNTVLSSSYNSTANTAGVIKIANIRANVNYILLKKHNLSMSAVQLFKKGTNVNSLSEFTATLGYNYSFDLNKPKKKEKNRRR